MKFYFLLSLFVFQSLYAFEFAVSIDDLPVSGVSQHSKMPPAEIAQIFIKTLNKHQALGTVGFVNGRKLEEFPNSKEALKLWHQAGYEFGNHTFSHGNVNHVSMADFLKDVEKNEVVLADYVPKMSEKLFRFPYLAEGNDKAKREGIKKYFSENRMRNVPVTIDLSEWSWNEAYLRCQKKGNEASIKRLRKLMAQASVKSTEEAISLSQLLFKSDVKHILLFHFTEFNALALDDILTSLKAHGGKIIAVRSALEDPVYRKANELSSDEGKTLLKELARSKSTPFNAGAFVEVREVERTCRN